MPSVGSHWIDDAQFVPLLDFLADSLGMLHYLQERRVRLGSFPFDYAVRKRLRGVDLVRSIETTE